MKVIFGALFILVINNLLVAQHEDHANQSHEQNEVITMRHKLTLVMANSLITSHVKDESNTVLIAPTFGLNYDFMFHARWGVGLHSDIILQQFKIEKHDEHEELIRENPIAICVMGIYKPAPKLSLLLV